MTRIRTGRRVYYNLFSHFYDAFINIMEHEVPRRPLIKLLFNLRMLAMGSSDAREFVEGGAAPYERIFSAVTLHHTPSGKSRLFVCRR